MDTGIGAHAYSIIEQGKVDAMLMANPAERRNLLEEAAGVARFKSRKVEAIRKLERSEVNLVRVREQLESTERRLRIVRGQAAKARRFQDIDGRHRELRTELALDAYHALRESLEQLTRQVGELESRRQQLSLELADLEDAKQNAEIARQEQIDHQRDLEQQRLDQVAKKRHAEQRAELTGQNRAENEQHLAEDRTHLQEFAERITSLDEAIQQAGQEIEQAVSRTQSAERAVAVAGEQRTEFQQTIVDARQLCEQAGEQLSKHRQMVARHRSQLDSLEKRDLDLQEQASRQEAKAGQIETGREEAHSSRTATESVLQVAQDRVESLEGRQVEHDHRAATLGERQAELAGEISDLRRQRAGWESRRHLLDEMQVAREGLDDAVKFILDHPDDFPSVRGLLVDAINTGREHAAVVEAALGNHIDLLLVETREELQAMRAAGAELPGRVELIAAEWGDDDQRELEMETELSESAHSLGVMPVLNYVQADPAVQGIVTRLLSRTAVVEDLETALRLTGSVLPGWRFVTRAGEVLETNGCLWLGRPAAAGETGETGESGGVWESGGAGRLSRRVELTELQNRLSALDNILDCRQTELDQRTSESEAQQKQQKELIAELTIARHAVVDAQYHIQRLDHELARLERERVSLAGEGEELQRREDALCDERDSLNAELDGCTEREEVLSRYVEESRATLEQARGAVEKAQDRLTAARVHLGEESAKVETARREKRHLDSAREEAKRQHDIADRQIERRLAQIEQYQATIETALEEIQEADQTLQRLEEEVHALDAVLVEHAEKVKQAAEKLEAGRIQAGEIDRQFQTTEIQRREQEIKRETLEERTLEEFELNLSEAYLPYRMRREEDDFEALDREAAETEADELRLALKKLGNINIDSIEEEKTLESRNEDLIGQVSDIDQACSELRKLIDELEVASRQKFQESFEAIREHFAGPKGMFRRLFGGGRRT